MDETRRDPGPPPEPEATSKRDEAARVWEPGRVVSGRYKLERKLGAGAMGEVFLAWDRLLRKPVAIKTLRRDLAKNRTIVRRFLREVALAQSVTHPNVVRIYDTGEAGTLPYFTMEYLQGQQLDQLVAEGAKDESSALTLREIREVCWDVLHAMEAAHEVGVIHRDLKPSNVMLTHRGAIVMDFGVAGIDTAPELSVGDTAPRFDSLVHTEAGTIFGSPAYMAPELWEGAPASVQSDLYSFGVMLYQMLTGRLPYDAPTAAAFLEKLRSESPPSVRSLRKDTPWTLALLVRRCMHHDPQRRPPSALAASNLISPLRDRRRRRLFMGGAALLLAASALYLAARVHPRWHAEGLPDAVAAADLAAAVRTYDAGDLPGAARHLTRLHRRAPASPALLFWRATVHHAAGDEPGRRQACADSPPPWSGAEPWTDLADAACGPSYELALPLLGTLTRAPGAMDDPFLPLAVTGSLVPRVEAAGGKRRKELEGEVRAVLDRLDYPPQWQGLWVLPTSWALARVHLEVALGRVESAAEHLGALPAPVREEPAARRLAAWLALLTGDLERARALAHELALLDPIPRLRLLLEDGRLRAAWNLVRSTSGTVHHAAARTLWCGYAYRFELDAPPERCRDIPPGFVRALWGLAPAGGPDLRVMSPLESTLIRRQIDLDEGDCRPAYAQRLPLLTHVAAPFELLAAQIEIAAALCPHDPDRADLAHARRVADALVALAPKDPWSLLLQARVREALGEPARPIQVAVLDRWRRADPNLPLVRDLRRHLHPDAPP